MNKLRKNGKKGFTLVEIIVVLVIIAILMAALTPVMIGWIREARDSTLVAEGRTGLVAAQALVANHIATGGGPQATAITGITATFPTSPTGQAFDQMIGGLAAANFTNITWNADAEILTINYTNGTLTVPYTAAGGWGASRAFAAGDTAS